MHFLDISTRRDSLVYSLDILLPADHFIFLVFCVETVDVSFYEFDFQPNACMPDQQGAAASTH